MSYFDSTTILPFNTTTVGPDHTQKIFTGFLYLSISCVLFGTNLLPTKHFKIGDGMFYQFNVSLGIFISNFVLYCFQGFPKFYILPMLGGVLWTCGNLLTALILKCLGVGLGTFCTNIVMMIIGWANVRFGWFGSVVEKPKNPLLNYLGVFVIGLSALTLLFVKTDNIETVNEGENRTLIGNRQKSIIVNNDDEEIVIETYNTNLNRNSMVDRMSPIVKRLVGILSASIAGFFYGIMLSPIRYLLNNDSTASKDMNNYTFPLSVGIFISSSSVLIIYSIIKKGNPKIYPSSIFPCMGIGILWCLANLTYLLSTNILSQAITYPISSCFPAIIISLIGVFYNEIKGLRSYFFLFLSGLIVSIGSVICGISD